MNGQGAGRIVSRVVGAVVGAVALVFALLFSVALFVALAVAGVVLFGYLWWKTRALRRVARDQRERGGRTIESTEIYEAQEARIEDRSKAGR